MPSLFPMTGVFSELGSGAPGNEGRSANNVKKLFYDSDGFQYVMRSNAQAASRAALEPTMVDETNTDTRGGANIQMVSDRFHNFDGVWQASVAASNGSDDTDIQAVLYRGSASAVPVESGRSRAASGTLAIFAPATLGSFVSESIAMTALADLHHLKYAIVVGGSVASSAVVADLLLHGLSPL